MQLRKSVKAPRRYEDEQAEEADHPERISPAKVPSHLAYRGQVIPYNPNLPPAAFPTLDTRQPNPARENQLRATRENNHPIHRNGQTQYNAPLDLPSQSQQPSFHNRQDAQRFTQQPAGLEGTVTPASCLHSPQHPHMALPGERPRPHTDNGPGNPIWEMNMNLMAELGRTAEEEVMAEMETSDEDEATPRPKRKTDINAQCPKWDEIALALRIDMIHAVGGEDNQVVQSCRRLRLTDAQQETMIEELHRHYEREAAEEANIAEHQRQVHEALLSGRRTGTQEAFQASLSTNLYKDLDREDTIATPGDLASARSYLIWCGLDTVALDGWGDATHAADVERTMEESDEELMAKYPNSVSMKEANEMYPGPILTTSTQEVLAAGHVAPPSTPVNLPISHSQEPMNRHTAHARKSQLGTLPNNLQTQSPFSMQPAINLHPPSQTIRRRSTEDTIEVDAGPGQVLQAGNAASPELGDTPVQPQQNNGSGSGSGSAPKIKRTTKIVKKRKPPATSTASGTSDTGNTPKAIKTARKKPVSTTPASSTLDVAQAYGGNQLPPTATASQYHHSMPCPTMTTQQGPNIASMGSTIGSPSQALVDASAQGSVPAAQAGPETAAVAGGNEQTAEKKSKAGRPRKSKGADAGK
ncbi:MAG: hypothetical protein Q9201_000224 [Fulgogasparrea decipioides]